MGKESVRNMNMTGWAGMIAILIVVLGSILVSASTGPYWTKSYPLSSGLAAMHEIQVDGRAELVLHSPPGGNFDLYAMRSDGPSGSCPSDDEIMSRAEFSTEGMDSDLLVLDQGLWCLLVYARSGSGTCLLEASAVETGTDDSSDSADELLFEGSDWIPEEEPGDGDGPFLGEICQPVRTIEHSGVLEGRSPSDEPGYVDGVPFAQAYDLYSFLVGGDRSDVELIVLGPCGDEVADHLLTDGEVSSLLSHTCGFGIYMMIYQDCDPQAEDCRPIQYVNWSHSNGYFRIEDPVPGSTYYVLINEYFRDAHAYAYDLLIRSYQCW